LRPAVEVRIEELVLDSAIGADTARMAAVLPDGLERLIARRGIPPGLADTHAVTSALRGAPTPEHLATAVYEGMTRCSS
jgi:hypothetical protein